MFPNKLFDHVTATQAQFEALFSDIHKTKFLFFQILMVENTIEHFIIVAMVVLLYQ